MSKFMMIAGPCVIESEDNVMLIAETIKGIAQKYDIDYYFKASFDKANRTSIACGGRDTPQQEYAPSPTDQITLPHTGQT